MKDNKILDRFMAAIHARRKVLLTFVPSGSSQQVERVCAPMDYGPKRKEHVPVNRYHLWDYGGKPVPHTLSIEVDQVLDLETLDEVFDPAEFVTWSPNWWIDRDWGHLS